MNKEYAHFDDYPRNKWPWADFTPRELRSKSDNKLMIDRASMDKLQALRSLIRKPMRITSAYRSPAHNKKIKGAKSSMHMKALAFDVQMEGHDPAQFEAAARQVGFTGFGFYGRMNFIHVDTGRERHWFGRGETSRWFEKADSYNGPSPTPKRPPRPANGGLMAIIQAIIAAIVAAFTQRKPK